MNILHLDVFTIIVIVFTGNFLILAIFLTYKIGIAADRSYRFFIAGKLLQGLAWPLLGLRGQIPDIISADVGNSALIIGFAFEALALTTVSKPDEKWNTVFAIIAAAGIAAFWIFANTPAMRVGIASTATAVLYITASMVMIRTSKESRLRLSLGFLCVVFSIILLFRSGLDVFSKSQFSLLTPNFIQTLTFLFLYFLMLSGGIGFLLILKERNDRLLAESEEKYRLVVTNVNEAIIIMQDEKLVFANPRMLEIVGLSESTIENKQILDFIHPDDRDLVMNNYRRRISGEEFGQNYDFRIIRIDGSVIWMTISATRILWKGEPATLSLLTDINDRKNMEKERENIILSLKKALSEVKTLNGLLPICASCKKIRDDNGYWNQIEIYIREHSEADFSHGLCPECAKKLYPEIR